MKRAVGVERKWQGGKANCDKLACRDGLGLAVCGLAERGNAVEKLLLTRSEGSVRTLILNRPDRLNALSTELLSELNLAFAAIEGDDTVHAVLLTGAGRSFSAGADLRLDLEASVDLGDMIEASYNPLIRRMRALPKPIVCAVNGVAAGAGMNLALAGDIVVAGKDASFAQLFVRIGLSPDAGGTYFLPRLAGMARARGLAMLGETLSADVAESYGLIWKTFDSDMLMTEALTIATNLAAKPGLALAAIKSAFNASDGNSLDKQLDMERDLQRELGKSADFFEGVTAFREKRPPVFGRNVKPSNV
jgi:2-(1,2-epoxy-1,2-dihydrophenyl)acetyl-CoA isomerase